MELPFKMPATALQWYTDPHSQVLFTVFPFSLSQIIGIFIELVLAEKLLNYWSVAHVDGLCYYMSADSCCVALFDRDANQRQI